MGTLANSSLVYYTTRVKWSLLLAITYVCDPSSGAYVVGGCVTTGVAAGPMHVLHVYSVITTTIVLVAYTILAQLLLSY